MVDKAIRTAFKAERELEHLMDDGHPQDVAEQEFNTLKNLAETAILQTAKITEQWGKEALNKAKEVEEEITL